VLLIALVLGAARVADAGAATGSISGTVTSASTHAGLAGVEVCAVEELYVGGSERSCVFTGPTGAYAIDSLVEGTYRVHFWPRHGSGLNYLPEYYEHKDFWNYDPVSVGATATTGVDAELTEGGSIEGRVTSELDGTPLGGVEVCAKYEYEDRESGCAVTDADGRYLIVGLWEREYRLQFFPERSGLPYFRSYGGLVGFHAETENWPQAEPVSVSLGQVMSSVNQTLKPAAEIKGFVTAAADGHGLAGILVCVVPALELSKLDFWQEVRCTRTNGGGAYSIGRLEGGGYKVLFSVELREYIDSLPPWKPEEDGYPSQYWSGGTSWSSANVLALTAPAVVTGIDARLGPGPPPSISSPPPSTTIGAPAPFHRTAPKCKHGRQARKVKGHYRCVKSRPDKHGNRVQTQR
jgi:hypothetical protein